MEIQVLKASNGPAGMIVKYLYDGNCFRLYPIPEGYVPQTATELRKQQLEEEELTNSES